MPHGIVHYKTGKTYMEDHPEYAKVLAENNAATIRQLVMAVAELQHRLHKVDSMEVNWPGDTYYPDTLPDDFDQ